MISRIEYKTQSIKASIINDLKLKGFFEPNKLEDGYKDVIIKLLTEYFQVGYKTGVNDMIQLGMDLKKGNV